MNYDLGLNTRFRVLGFGLNLVIGAEQTSYFLSFRIRVLGSSVALAVSYTLTNPCTPESTVCQESYVMRFKV